MTAIDHRIAVRRHTVREAGARRRLGQVIVVISFFVVVALIVLLFKSPLMAVKEIEVTGSDHSNVTAVLDRHNVAPGVPTISVRAGALVADVEADPWVARARATITWPGTVVLTVLEHEPIAWRTRLHASRPDRVPICAQVHLPRQSVDMLENKSEHQMIRGSYKRIHKLLIKLSLILFFVLSTNEVMALSTVRSTA